MPSASVRIALSQGSPYVLSSASKPRGLADGLCGRVHPCAARLLSRVRRVAAVPWNDC